jgi:hypothetical protein
VKYRWLQKNVDILDIEEGVKSFLQQQGFRVTSSESNDQKKIVGVLRHVEGRKRVIVAIAGKPDDFTVDFLGGETAKLIERFASLISFLGAGALELQSLRSKEWYEKLEDKFWKDMEDLISRRSRRGLNV